ncbi:MAG: CoA-binding protein, partial [Candidatus Dormibacteraeota bacterium]|nr:CoA-binding protein [Candidatus Dormibacteraeota bacterium]
MAGFLDPRSIALIGATERSAWSAALLANLTGLGYEGEIHLVNPRRSEQFGRPCHSSLDVVKGAIDHAYVLTGTAAALGVIDECGRRGVRYVTMITA